MHLFSAQGAGGAALDTGCVLVVEASGFHSAGKKEVAKALNSILPIVRSFTAAPLNVAPVPETLPH